tara:strand:- start:142 stop:684 length:543 start_codon:yes stop_codon:yes gene_type:complete
MSWQLIGGLLSGLGGVAAGAYGMSQMQQIDPTEVEDWLEPWKTKIDDMSERGQGLMDMSSETNQAFRKQYMENAADNAANQNMLLERNMGPGMSGIMQAKSQNAMSQANQIGQQNFMNQFSKNLNTGAGMINNATNQMGQYSENIAQSYISNIQQQNMANASLWSGISSGLLSFVPELGG